jgi:hypothetical protein
VGTEGDGKDDVADRGVCTGGGACCCSCWMKGCGCDCGGGCGG